MRLRLALLAVLAAAIAVVVIAAPWSEHESAAERRAESRGCTPEAVHEELARERAGGAEADTEKEREGEEAEREGEKPCGEGAMETQELSEPNEVMLARQLVGADAGVDPAKYFAAAEAQAADLPTADATWTLAGPTNIGGRVLDIVVDPTNADTIYIAAATGGVWKSVNKGSTFTPAWPDGMTQTVGALAIDSEGVLYAGTGEAGPGGGSSTYGGDGLYRSADGGATWQHLGLEDTNRIGRVVVDPKNDDRIFVAGTGPLYKHGGGRGLFLSEDGGAHFTKVLTGENDTAGAVDVAIDPTDSKTVYAAMWDNFRERDRRLYEGLGSGLYKSTDGGKTWARVGTPIFGPRPDLGRIGVAVAPDGTVYANASGASGLYNGFFTSTDGGATWATGQPPTNPQDSFYVYGWWFGRIYVDPADPKHVYQAALVLQESNDGGQSWHNAPGGCSNICANGHADQHAMAWDPKVPGRVYLGNDGGVFRSDDNGKTAEGWKRFKSLPISQVNGFDVSQQDPNRLVVGLQDNGQQRNWTTRTSGGSQFNDFGGGDGQRVLIAPTRKNVLYGCSQYGVCDVSTDGGENTTSMGFSSPETGAGLGTRWNWFTPIEFDPSDDKTVYTGSELVSVSHDDGATVLPISPDLSNGPGRETNPLFKNYGTVSTIAVAPGGKTLYAGTDDGNLWFTHDSSSLVAWTKASDPDLPDAWVTRVEVDPADANHALVTYSGFRQADDAAYVLETRDGGASWESIQADLPAAPVNDVILVGQTKVAATDVGVFFRKPGDAGWTRLGSNLPLAPAYELRYAKATDELFVGTFGRGVYKTGAAPLS